MSPLTGCGQEKKMQWHCAVITITRYICYICAFQPNTSDFIKQALSYTLLSGMTSAFQVASNIPTLKIKIRTVVVFCLQQTALFST